MPNYSKKQLLELYENLPEELQEAIFSEKTAENIYSACKKNGLKESSKMSEISEHVGYSLLGLLPPDKIMSELSLERNRAKRILSEIEKSVFLPVKEKLEELYGVEIMADDVYKEPIE